MECRQTVKARIEQYLQSPESRKWALDLSGLGLTTVPPLPPDLEKLDLGDNQLSRLPDHLPKALRSLGVARNQLDALPANLPAQLQKLYANENQLNVLPKHLPERLQKFHVGSNYLSALPARLPESLRELDASYNRLSTLPDRLPRHLQKLYVSLNRMSTLPGRLPEGLQVLDLSDNALSALPDHLPKELQKLYVGNNRLSALPEHLPDGLQRLDVFSNLLSAFPPGLLNVRTLVELSDNPLPATVLHRLQQITSAPDYQGPRILFSMTALEALPTLDSVRPLGDAMQNWLGQESAPWTGFTQEAGATEFSLFLDKLAQSIIGRNPAFRMTFQAWLREMAAHPSLRAHLFAVAQGATASCQDRVMLTANDMAKARLLFQVERGDYDQRLPELVGIARGMFRLEKLEAIARQKAASLMFVDEVEVYLAYQVKLCAPLRLPLVADDMAYFKVSGVSDKDLLAAEATVKEMENREFRDFLLTWTPWLEAQKKGRGLSQEAARARQFSLWDAEYEQPLARLEDAIDAIDGQLNNDSRSTTSTTDQTHRLQVERQRLTAQKNALVNGARTLSDDIARRIAVEGHASLPVSPSLLDMVWDTDGRYVGDSTGATGTGFQATGT